MTNERVIHEVERRYSVSVEQVNAVKKAMTANDFTFAYCQHQVDEYFTSAHKDFIATEECLRIRSVDSSTSLTWKPPSTDEIRNALDYWKEEVEFLVQATPGKVRRFLTALDFIPYVVVDKVREAYGNSLGAEVSCDEVAGLGLFVELEIQSEDIKSAREQVSALASLLSLDDRSISTVPYRDLVFEAKKRE